MTLEPAQQDLLARLDERSAWIVSAMKADKADWTAQLDALGTKIDAHRVEAEAKYAPKGRVAMLEKIVYGFCGLVLTGVAGAVIATVVKAGP